MNISIHQVNSITVKKEMVDNKELGEYQRIKIVFLGKNGIEEITVYPTKPIEIEEV